MIRKLRKVRLGGVPNYEQFLLKEDSSVVYSKELTGKRGVISLYCHTNGRRYELPKSDGVRFVWVVDRPKK